MSSSSKHHKKPFPRTLDISPSPSTSASSSIPRHSHRESEMRTHSSSSYWNTVIDKPSPSDYNNPPRSKSTSKPIQKECTGCKRTFTNTRSYEEHRAICNSEKPFDCEECGTAFKKNSNLVKHMKLVHRGEKNFPCTEPGCGRLFGQKSNLNSHVKAVHLGEKPFECTESNCGKKFSQKSGLKAHVKTVHKRERPYVCDCGSSFGHRGDLNRHIRVLHEKQRPFECHICPETKAFGRRSVLNRHMQTHQTDREGDTIMGSSSTSSHR